MPPFLFSLFPFFADGRQGYTHSKNNCESPRASSEVRGRSAGAFGNCQAIRAPTYGVTPIAAAAPTVSVFE
jgi:hypothetical protein